MLPAAIALVATLILAACGQDNGSGAAQVEQTELRYQGSVGTVTPVELAADLGYLGPIKLKWIGNTISGPQDIQSAATGDVDFGAAFNGAIIKLIAAGSPIKAVAGSYGIDNKVFGGFYVLDGSPITSPRDLFGKKVGMNTLGAHYEAILDEYLKRGGLSQDEIKKVIPTVVPPVNTEQSLREKQIDVAVLNGILRDKALARGGIHPLFSDYDLFGSFTAGSYVLREDFIKKNPTTTRQFVEGVGKAIEWSRATPLDQVIARFKDIIAKRDRKEDTTAIQYFKGFGVAGKGGLIADADFTRWTDWLKVNGQLKKDVTPAELFTNEFNSFRANS
ncbi:MULTISPECIES: ABC transporter substrate-binding protein [Protofrankia]|uniref:ABC transporter substrate-binding protein n=1 Tax=Protofrankia coriariae TaxID=1562887 RepID=A0ABR5F2F2_9ACTN|nr:MULTISPECIES: ABC transporter substrate-binding protein [Protofrankia]KLL10879.1 ABC transporter substrate-binding protein [Protofrankia coriariae]ONH38137.1 ABC transporter substrate-binding protein [Protofrankia sp. BMG5.30]